MVTALIIIGILLFVFAVVWLFLVGTKRHPDMKKYKTVRYAHRGLHGDGVAENSMTAFALAVREGYGIELDVRLSKDGELVVFHDDTLTRVAKIDGKVIDYTLEELGNFKLSDTSDTVPTFREVLDLVDGKVPLLVEIKEDPGVDAVSKKCAEMLAEYKGDYIVESFNPLSLRNFARYLPAVPRGILSQNYMKEEKYRKPLYLALGALLTNCICRPSFIAYNGRDYKSLSLRLVRFLFRTPTLAWTIRSEEDEEALIHRGFDSVIFEGYRPEKRS